MMFCHVVLSICTYPLLRGLGTTPPKSGILFQNLLAIHYGAECADNITWISGTCVGVFFNQSNLVMRHEGNHALSDCATQHLLPQKSWKNQPLNLSFFHQSWKTLLDRRNWNWYGSFVIMSRWTRQGDWPHWRGSRGIFLFRPRTRYHLLPNFLSDSDQISNAIWGRWFLLKFSSSESAPSKELWTIYSPFSSKFLQSETNWP